MSAPITRRHPLSSSAQPSVAPPLAPPIAPSTTHYTATSNPPIEADADLKLRNRSPSPSRLKEQYHGSFGSGPGKRTRTARAGTVVGLRKREWWILGVVSALGLVVRFWKLGYPDSVV